MSRSSITETVQRVQSLVDQVKSLNEDEYAFFLDLLLPEPEQPAVKVKRARKKRAPSAAVPPANKRRGLPTDTAPLLPVEKSEPMCGVCGNGEMFQDHFKPSPHYHEFKAAA